MRELAERKRREVELTTLDRAKRFLRVGDEVRFRDWRRPSLVQEGVVVGVWPASPTPPTPLSAYVQRAEYHDRSVVFYDEIVEVAVEVRA